MGIDGGDGLGGGNGRGGNHWKEQVREWEKSGWT